MRDLEVMRRLVFLLISVWSVLGNETMTEATDCLADLDSNKLGELSFKEETTSQVFSDECHYRVLQCESFNFCNIQWFFNGIPYDSWSLGNNSDTKYKLEHSNQTLIFLSTDVDAGGTYTCVVSNGVRNITRSINMSIEISSLVWRAIPLSCGTQKKYGTDLIAACDIFRAFLAKESLYHHTIRIMWPRLLDMEEKECWSVLRRLELEAYSSVISAFRAQGDLTPEKKSLLRSVASTLSISTERHKAEVRRAVNDEKLTTIAER
ncbi:uncharacterized protein LOC115922508 [Strongylocentrotus purpuratus]|uniref:Uncharacterized protein n=1 Tax=Strongylocentrotus purpuratus TaxID=7668 RepID=A0A7M7NIZ9_STRPU|nr:uncharacterized protein LOC115922508 [Strongylocentrotus purpuratus]